MTDYLSYMISDFESAVRDKWPKWPIDIDHLSRKTFSLSYRIQTTTELTMMLLILQYSASLGTSDFILYEFGSFKIILLPKIPILYINEYTSYMCSEFFPRWSKRLSWQICTLPTLPPEIFFIHFCNFVLKRIWIWWRYVSFYFQFNGGFDGDHVVLVNVDK